MKTFIGSVLIKGGWSIRIYFISFASHNNHELERHFMFIFISCPIKAKKKNLCSLVVINFLSHKRRLNNEELMLSNCGAGEESSESCGLQRDEISQS